MTQKQQFLSKLISYKEEIFETGTRIFLDPNSTLAVSDVLLHLPKKTLIAIDGLASSGKGELSKNLHEHHIAYVYSGLIWRAATYIFEDLQSDITDTEISLLTSLLSVSPGKTITLSYRGKELAYEQLKNPRIDSALIKYNNRADVRRVIDTILSNVFTSYNEPFIADLRGANTTYIKDVVKAGFSVIRILLYCEPETKIERRINEYLKRGSVFDEDTIALDILKRDINDIEIHSKPEFGGNVHPESLIIDTTEMSIEEVFQTSLTCIDAWIKRQQSFVKTT